MGNCKVTLQGHHHGDEIRAGVPHPYVIVRSTPDSPTTVMGKLYQTAAESDVKLYCTGNYIMTLTHFEAPAIRGEIVIHGLQPTAARDALQRPHKRFVERILFPKIQEELYCLERDHQRNLPSDVQEESRFFRNFSFVKMAKMAQKFHDPDGIDFFKVQCQTFKPAERTETVQMRHLFTKDEEVPAGSAFDPPKEIKYCTRSLTDTMKTIEKDTVLVRLDLLGDVMGYYLTKDVILNYIKKRFGATADISEWEFPTRKPEDLRGMIDDEDDYCAVKWVHEELERIILCHFGVKREEFAFEMIMADESLNLQHTYGGRYHKHTPSVLVLQLNVQGSKVIKVGKAGMQQDTSSAHLMLLQGLLNGAIQDILNQMGGSDFHPSSLRPAKSP